MIMNPPVSPAIAATSAAVISSPLTGTSFRSIAETGFPSGSEESGIPGSLTCIAHSALMCLEQGYSGRWHMPILKLAASSLWVSIRAIGARGSPCLVQFPLMIGSEVSAITGTDTAISAPTANPDAKTFLAWAPAPVLGLIAA